MRTEEHMKADLHNTRIASPSLALAALAFGTYRSIQTIDSGGVIGLVFIAMVLAWYTYWTWSNFKGRNA